MLRGSRSPFLSLILHYSGCSNLFCASFYLPLTLLCALFHFSPYFLSPPCTPLSALPVVMTPSSRMMLEWSNCPRMPASLRKERRCLSEQPARIVFMATGSSLLLGSLRQPRHTSPKSPGVVGVWKGKGDRQIRVTIPADRLAAGGRLGSDRWRVGLIFFGA